MAWGVFSSQSEEGQLTAADQLFSGKSLYYFKLQSLKLRRCRCPGMKKSAWGEMEQKTRGDWLYVHEHNTEGGVVVCAGRK